MSAPFGGMPTRWDPDSGPSTRVALIVPGSGYSPAHPLLEFGRQSLSQHGWTVQQLWWDQPSGEHDVDARAAWVCDQVRSALDAETDADRLLVVAKSLGTLAAPVARERRLDAIWMTPLFGHAERIDHRDRAQRTRRVHASCWSVVGPTRSGTRSGLGSLGCDVADIPDATHFMHVPGDAVRSAQIHVEVDPGRRWLPRATCLTDR